MYWRALQARSPSIISRFNRKLLRAIRTAFKRVKCRFSMESKKLCLTGKISRNRFHRHNPSKFWARRSLPRKAMRSQPKIMLNFATPIARKGAMTRRSFQMLLSTKIVIFRGSLLTHPQLLVCNRRQRTVRVRLSLSLRHKSVKFPR